MLFFWLKIPSSAVAGAIFAFALMLLMDGIIIARGETNVSHRITFVMLLPAIFSMVGFWVMIFISPVEVKNDVAVSKAVLFLAWFVCLSSTVGALVLCRLKFTGVQEREKATPGLALATFTSLMPLSGAILWWSRRSSYDDF